MKVTSSQANKFIRQLNEQLKALEVREQNARSFLAATGEDVESVRPAYDYASMQDAMAELETKIRKAKHALNVFNATTVIPEFGMTIDAMLIYLPQLTHRKNKLSNMKDALPKVREENYARNAATIDYRYANYDIGQVHADYLQISDELSRAQTALDVINSTVAFELDF